MSLPLKKLLNNNKHCYNKWSKEINTSGVESHRLEAIQTGLQNKIKIFRDALSNPETDDILIINETDDFIDDMETLSSKISNLLTNSSKSMAIDNKQDTIKLPKLELEPFYGDISHFDQFWSLFTTCVDNNVNLADAQKLAYLVSLLKGEAQKVVSGLLITPNNYKLAKNLIVSRYGHKKRLIHSLFQNLLNINECSQDSATIRSFYDQLVIGVRSLENQNVSVDQHSDLLTSHLLAKLPEFLRTKCINSFKNEQWLVSTLLDTLDKYIYTMEACDFNEIKTDILNSTFSSLATVSKNIKNTSNNKNKLNKHCIFCETETHNSNECRKNTTFSSRFGIIKRKRLCVKCFGNHIRKECQSDSFCEKCKGDHNTALCKLTLNNENLQKYKHQNNVTNAACSQVNTLEISCKTLNSIILQQIETTASNIDKTKKRNVNILFDTGSHLTYICNDTALYLGLNTTSKHNMQISTFMDSSLKNNTYSRVSLLLHGLTKTIPISAIVVPKICSLPITVVDIPPEFKNLDFSGFHNSCNKSRVDILIGMDLYWSIMCNQTVQSDAGLYASRSLLGWTISGCPKDLSTKPNVSTAMLISCKNIESFSQEIDQVFNHDFSFLGGISNDNDEAVFLQNIEYNPNSKRYSIFLPWKNKSPKLSDHRKLSEKRLSNLYSKLIKDSNLLDDYTAQIDNYLNEDIIELVDETKIVTSIQHYLPHHAVVKNNNSSTRLRIVFDASAKSRKNELSLNQSLLIGPKMIPLLLPVLLKFRCHKIGIISDIQKAFLMIEISENDRDSLRFLWFRDHTDHSLGVNCYRFKRLPFGLVCSPALLSGVLKHHLEVNNNNCNSEFYVDDFISGCDCDEDGISMFTDLKTTLSLANFNLHKFASNSQILNKKFSDAVEKEVVNVLGIKWFVSLDSLAVDLRKIESASLVTTKRSLLALLGNIFDPLGFFSPLTIALRLYFQKTWENKIDWDCHLPESLLKDIQETISTLLLFKNLSFNRFLCTQNETSITIVGFCDASQKAISCIFYMVVSKNEINSVKFICAKSRVRPINKPFTIPRLELLSCLLLINLYNSIKNCFPVHKVQFYSDSMCALAWIRNESKCWKQFVQSRVNIIRSFSDPYVWLFVPGEINPADIATRGVCRKDDFDFWISGPLFLQEGSKPSQPEHLVDNLTKEEIYSVNVVTATSFNDPLPTLDITRFSSYRRLLFTVSRILALFRQSKTFYDFTEEAEILLCRSDQARYCFDLIEDINLKRKLNVTNQLLLFISNDIIYVRSRIPPSHVAGKPRILLPYKSALSCLIIKFYHELVMHAGIAITLAKIRETFWVLKGRQAVKHVLYKCIFCKRVRGKSYQYPMPPELPEFRFSGKPFETVGLDYAGPFKTSPGSYILLFTCSVTRALHLELTPDLSTHHFKLALERFVGRRGPPKNFVSDNAKTFQAASIQLEAIRCTSFITTYLVDNKIRWFFNCSRAPWWGGWFERLVALIKDLLRKTMPKRRVLSFIEFETIIITVESILNSRPLSYLSSDDTTQIITPAHLIGIITPFITEFTSINDIFMQRCDITSRIWRVFTREYLSGLSERSAAVVRVGGVKPDLGDVCLLFEPNIPQWKWPLARVIELPTSRDGKMRRAKLKTIKGTIVERPLSRLIPLETK